MSTSIQHLHSSARFSEVTIHQGTVYLAGQLAADLSGNIQQQTQETLAIIDDLLQQAKSHKSLILNTTIYLQNIQRDYHLFNEVWDKWCKDIKAPPRTCVQAMLYDPNVLVEISIIAAQDIQDKND